MVVGPSETPQNDIGNHLGLGGRVFPGIACKPELRICDHDTTSVREIYSSTRTNEVLVDSENVLKGAKFS